MNCRLPGYWSALAIGLAAATFGPEVGRGQPAVSSVTPHAVAPGQVTELTIAGTKLDGGVRCWTSFPAAVEILASDDNAKSKAEIRCRVSVAAGVQPGIGGLVIATPAGLSDVTYLMVDHLASIAEAKANDKLDKAQELSLPIAVDGASSGTAADYFRFKAAAGERLSCEVVANRLGWDFDPVVRVLDAEGKELVLADDDLAGGVDPRFVFTVPRAGTYVLELRDNRYKPGGRYRLRLGGFPLVTTPMPLVVQRGTLADLTFVGPRAEDGVTNSIQVLAGEARGATTVAVQAGKESPLGWAALGISNLPAVGEREAATVCAVPCVLNGVLGQPGEVDRWKLKVSKGQALRLRAITRSLGSAAVLSLKLSDAAGKQLAVSPVTESDEPVMPYTPAADGEITLTVEELAGRGGSDFGYAVECRSGPLISLVLKNDKNNRLRYAIAESGAFYLDVQAQRSGYDGPITLGLDSPRSGWQLWGNVIAAKANETRLYLTPPADWNAGELTELRIVGRGTSGDPSLSAAMNTMVQLRAARPYFPYPPSWLDGTVFVSATKAKPPLFAVSNPAVAEFDAEAGQAQLAIEMERLEAKFKDAPVTIVPVGLPQGVTATIKRNGSGAKETYELLLKGPKTLAPGQYTFRYFAFAELGTDGYGTYSGDVRLRVGEKSTDMEKKATGP